MRSIFNFFYPPRCLVCDATQQLVDGLHICQACESELRLNRECCSRCGLPMPGVAGLESAVCGACLQQPPPFERCVSPFFYAQPLEWMIQQLKFNARLSFAPLLAELMRRRLPVELYRHDSPDVIIPMPLHPRRLRQRGFNQSLLLAQPLAQALSIQLDNDCCRRRKDTAHQSGMDARQRRRNIRGAFEYRHQPGYRHAVIVDDVVTTASTVSEMSRVLLAGGVEHVDVLSLSRADR